MPDPKTIVDCLDSSSRSDAVSDIRMPKVDGITLFRPVGVVELPEKGKTR